MKSLFLILVCLLMAQSAWAAEPWAFGVVREFGFQDRATIRPTGSLLRAGDGKFYGVADHGLYRIDADGAGFRVFRLSPSAATEGQMLLGTLWEGTDGRLYGASRDSSGTVAGVLVFQRDGTEVQLLHRFEEAGAAWTVGEQLVVAADGSVFGQAWRDGLARRAVVFRLTPDGTRNDLRELPTGFFSQFPATQRGVVTDANGVLYGAVPNGGASGHGIVFRLQPDGSGFGVLHEFGTTDVDLGSPAGPLRRASDGNLYGLASGGFPSTNSGAIYRVTPGGEATVVHRLFRGPDEPLPEGGLTEGSDGRLYGSSQEDGFGIFSKIYRLGKDGSGFEIIYTSRAVSVGIAGLTEGADGRFYTTSFRGPTDRDAGGNGSVFRIESDGSNFTNLWLFHSTGGDGRRPYGPPIVASDGRLYGTTVEGGPEDGGTVFRVGRDGTTPQILRSFEPRGTTGSAPFAGVIEGHDGFLYGAASADGAAGRGTLFRLRKDGGDFQVLHHFAASGDGAHPMVGLTQGGDHTLYGVTLHGGTNGSSGTVFRMATNGSGYRVLHDFNPANQSVSPSAPLLLAQDGELYGTTSIGGPANGGTIFALRTNGTGFRVLHAFATNPGAVFRPGSGALFEGGGGRLLGTTFGGGFGFGAIYRIDRNGGGFAVTHRFTGGAGGQFPEGGLTRAPGGGFVGVMQAPGPGGTNFGDGLVYNIDADGGGFVVLGSFRANTSYFAPGHLAAGPDAALYGAEQNGGVLGAGQIYRLTPPDFQPRFVDGTARRLASGAFTAQVAGTFGQAALVEASSDVQEWNPVATILFGGEPVAFTNATAEAFRFYRMRVP